jgi:hypothetical protein
VPALSLSGLWAVRREPVYHFTGPARVPFASPSKGFLIPFPVPLASGAAARTFLRLPDPLPSPPCRPRRAVPCRLPTPSRNHFSGVSSLPVRFSLILRRLYFSRSPFDLHKFDPVLPCLQLPPSIRDPAMQVRKIFCIGIWRENVGGHI